MNLKRKVLLIGYSIIMIFAGILYVPVTSVWGPEKNIDVSKYVHIWELVDKSMKIDGYTPIYLISLPRVLITLLVITIVAFILYLVFDDKKTKVR